MCTVTIVPHLAGAREPGPRYRMACSRDESHGRASALPPVQHNTENGLAYLMPVDPASGGTWAAVNQQGLALTLLNYNLPHPPTGRTASRGAVIPELIGCSSVNEVAERLPAIPAGDMLPFRLVFTDGVTAYTWRSTQPPKVGEGLDATPLTGPMMWTSSGLGDHLVEPPRRELFESWFSDDPAKHADEQLAFHQHRWEDRPHLSVAMSREDARTVSYTTVDVAPDRVTMRYHPDRPDLTAEEVEVSIKRQPAAPVRP